MNGEAKPHTNAEPSYNGIEYDSPCCCCMHYLFCCCIFCYEI